MRKRTRVLIRRILIRLSVLLFIVGAFITYFKTGFFTIQNYTILGVPEEYQHILVSRFKTYETQRLYKILPGNRVISYHKKDMEASVREILPNTAIISISSASLHTIKVSVTAYSPLFRAEGKQAITKEGVVYTEIGAMHELPLLTFSTSSTPTPELLSKISDIIPKISATLFLVERIQIDEHSDIYISGDTSSSSVILSSTADIKKTWSNLLSAIGTDPLKSELESNKNRMEYLDTRFGNKVFYKFTNGAKPAIIQNHDSTASSSAPTLR